MVSGPNAVRAIALLCLSSCNLPPVKSEPETSDLPKVTNVTKGAQLRISDVADTVLWAEGQSINGEVQFKEIPVKDFVRQTNIEKLPFGSGNGIGAFLLPDQISEVRILSAGRLPEGKTIVFVDITMRDDDWPPLNGWAIIYNSDGSLDQINNGPNGDQEALFLK